MDFNLGRTVFKGTLALKMYENTTENFENALEGDKIQNSLSLQYLANWDLTQPTPFSTHIWAAVCLRSQQCDVQFFPGRGVMPETSFLRLLRN